MLQGIMDMVKLFDQHQPQQSQEGSADAAHRRPSLEELLAYLQQANSGASAAAQLERQAVAQGIRDAAAGANFESIIANHIVHNGNESQKAMLRKNLKRLGDKADERFRLPEDFKVELPWFDDDCASIDLLRSLGSVDGVSVEIHPVDEPTSRLAKNAKKTTKKVQQRQPSAAAQQQQQQKGSAPPPAEAAKKGGKQATSAPPPATLAEIERVVSDVTSLDDDEGDIDDMIDGEDVVVHEEDLQQINHMIQSLEPLSLETLESLSAEWEVSFPNGGEHLLYRTNITERIRYLAATMVVGVADRFQVLQSNHQNTQDAERERMMLVNNLVLSLWHGINVLTENVRKNFAVIFGLEADSTAHDVCVAVAGLGIAAFFEPLPVSLIERVCRELNLPALDPKTDPDLIHEAMSHQICAHFYPVLGRLPDMNLRCTTQLTVHENGPGSYTCTLDNALLMDLIMRQLHVSNKFTCQKVKWRACVEVSEGYLSFAVWHHDPRTFNVTLALRTSEKGKKKKPSATEGDALHSVVTGGLYLEKKDTASPGRHVGFRNIVQLQQVYRNLTTSPNGLRLYNRTEDRIIFQFGMEMTPVETAAMEAAAPAETVTNAAAPRSGPVNANGKSGKGNANAAATANNNTVDASTAGQTIAELIEQEEREKREKLAAKTRQKNDKRFKQLEQAESQARDQIASQYASATNQIGTEIQKSYQKSLQKKKDRERKAELAKATPSAELQVQLAALEQAVRAARASLAKLVTDKNKEEKESVSLQQQIDNRNEELAALQESSEANEAILEEIRQEIEETEARNEARKKALEAKNERRAKRKPAARSQTSAAAFGTDDSMGANHTLSIKDFQSFWNISSTSVPTSSAFTASSGAPAVASPSFGQSSMSPSSIGSGFVSKTNVSVSSSASALSMGLDLGAFSTMSSGMPSASMQQMPPGLGLGHPVGFGGRGMAPPAGFSLNGDAQPFYGSAYPDPNAFGQKSQQLSQMMSNSAPQQRSSIGFTGGPPGGPVMGNAPMVSSGIAPQAFVPPPSGFSPYGVAQLPLGHGRLPSPGDGLRAVQHRPPQTQGQYPPPPPRQGYNNNGGRGVYGFENGGF